jgi:hypothetical protein
MENDMKGKVMGVDAANRRKNAKMKVTASGGANPGANLKPLSKLAPKGSIRPRTRSDKEAEDEADAAADRAMKHSQPPKLVYKAAGGAVKKMAMGGKLKMVEKDGKKVPSFAADGVGKMAMGGMCRGMGAAKKGGSYKG